MLYFTWLVMAIIIALAVMARVALNFVPGKAQAGFEIVMEFLAGIMDTTLGKEDTRRFMPFIATIFIFILLGTWIGCLPDIFGFLGMTFALIHKAFGGNVTITSESIFSPMISPAPGAWYSFFFHLPHHIEKPTKYLSTCLALGISVFLVVHANGIREKGFFHYFMHYMHPLPDTKPWCFFFFLNPFFYLNIISEMTKAMSHSLRLFGNIAGGVTVILIVSELAKFIVIPLGLNIFFVFFEGLVQAFVFTMLAVTYIGLQKPHGEHADH
ncbi:MAG: F0F1 ATP synthase subunit A [Candidatus Margulisiibacteriota bacterium]